MRRHLGTCRHAGARRPPCRRRDSPRTDHRRVKKTRASVPPVHSLAIGSRLPWFLALSWPQRLAERAREGERNPSCRLQEACLSLQGRASDRGDKALRSRRHTHGTRAAVAGVGVIWILLALAYAWSVRKLGRVSRTPDPRSSSGRSPSSGAPRIELVHTDEKRSNGTPTTQPRRPRPGVTLARR